VAVIGSLASVDLGLAESLTEAGVTVDVFRHRGEGPATDLDPEIFPELDPARVLRFGDSLDLVRRIRSYDFLYTYTAQLGFALGKFLRCYPLLRRLGWPAFMNIGTGSDIMERAIEDSPEGAIQRRTMRAAVVNIIPAYPAAIAAAAELRLPNVCTLPFPHRPLPPTARGHIGREPRADGPLHILHATNLDWGHQDAGQNRRSTKGNDRFLRALGRFVGEADRDVRLTLLDRGPDRVPARQLVSELGLDAVVTWKDELRHDALYAAMAEADLVVDQFDVGAMGGIAWEALTLGRPLLTYLEPSTAALIYDELPPVLNARTEDEILCRLREAADPARLAATGAATLRWAAPRSAVALAPRYLLYPALMAGGGLELLVPARR
jgi:hypothetical protein